MISKVSRLGGLEMNESVSKKYSGVELVAWMGIAAMVTFCIMSYRYTKIAMQSNNTNNYDYYYQSSGDTSFKKLKKVADVLENEYLYEYDMKTLEEGAIRGMLEALNEPYTSYFDTKETEAFLTETEGEYEGVGIYIAFDEEKNKGIVLLPIKGSPAAYAGVLPGDYILEVDGESVIGVPIDEISKKIKGKAETQIIIKFERLNKETNEYESFEKTMMRQKITISPFEHKVLENNIGYIAFESFDEKAEATFKKEYNELVKDKKVKGVIIDLRNNPGGLITAAEGITDRLLPTGVITYTLDKKGNKEYLYSDSERSEVPIVLIVNKNSASASEIMAAAVKDTGVGEIVGTTTYGKGLVQKFKSLGDETYIKLTISEYFSPNGTKINKTGVVPNYEVEDNENTEEDEQLQKAIEVIKSKF